MTAVSNSRPLILFSRIGRLYLLRTPFNEILIPPAVWREVVPAGAGRAGQRDIAQEEWIQLRSLPDSTVPTRFAFLDSGETEALALASALDDSFPISIDDEQARRVAQDSGLLPVGCGGILVRPKEAALIPAVRPIMMDLRSAGLFLSDTVLRRILDAAGEP